MANGPAIFRLDHSQGTANVGFACRPYVFEFKIESSQIFDYSVGIVAAPLFKSRFCEQRAAGRT